MKTHQGFTLIELLIVIVIIGILAAALIPRLTGLQAKARDTKRMADLKQVQTALELYNNENGKYPSTQSGSSWMGNNGWLGNCSSFSGFGVSGPMGYIPGLAPTYLTELPLDPKPSSNKCYIYRSNGIDYMFMAFQTVEGNIPVEFWRPSYNTGGIYAIYTNGARQR